MPDRGDQTTQRPVDRHASHPAGRTGPCRPYDQEAFHFFLDLERRRSEVRRQPFLLMLIELPAQAGGRLRVDPASDELFSVLSCCLRETDFFGWYRDGHVAGAVLTQHGDIDHRDPASAIRERVGAAIRQRLSSKIARGLRMRIYRLSSGFGPRSA